MANFDAGTVLLDRSLTHDYEVHLLQGDMVGVVNRRGDVIVEESIDCDLEKLRQTPMNDRAAKLLLVRGIEKARAEREEQRADEAGPRYVISFVVSGLDVDMDPDRPLTKRERDGVIQRIGEGSGVVVLHGSEMSDLVIPVKKIDYAVLTEWQPPKERTGW